MGQSATKTEVRGSNPSPGQTLNFSYFYLLTGGGAVVIWQANWLSSESSEVQIPIWAKLGIQSEEIRQKNIACIILTVAYSNRLKTTTSCYSMTSAARRRKSCSPIKVFTKDVSPQQGDLRLSGPPSGQGAGGLAQVRNRRVLADLREDSLATVPPTPRWQPTHE
ncbi:hypothetical protein PoB_000998100 [Plakobranchus ocellatus]|uniref:Uncharacterized protein n=1 Tax=Plakobranchus ocellatus TaxID=259542 RepID=A0AAV3YJP8_9GAST|nr:hypothetical protein PoB_000998100 [Plakobranchus ocellatus]